MVFVITLIIFRLTLGINLSRESRNESFKMEMNPESVITEPSKIRVDTAKYLKKTYNEYLHDEIDTIDFLSNIVGSYYDSINNNEAHKAYKMINREFIEEEGLDLDIFKKLEMDRFNFNVTIAIKNYTEDDSGYSCKVLIYPSHFGDEKIDESIYDKEFLRNFHVFNDGSISFDLIEDVNSLSD